MSNRAKLESLLTLVNSAAQEAIAMYENVGGYVPSIDSTESHPLDEAIDQVALRRSIRVLEGACAQLCMTLAPPSHTINNLMQVYDHACLLVVLRENVTDILKLARIMRLLATRGCYSEVDLDTFANNRLSLVLHSDNPIRHMIRPQAETYSKNAVMVYETLKDPEYGHSNDPSHAPVIFRNNKDGITGTFFDWMKQDSFHHAMRAASAVMGSLAVLTHFPFEKYSTVVDVGGGIGAFSIPLAKTHKHIKTTVHDLSEVLVQVRDVWAKDCPEAIQENRVEFTELDFLTQVPVKGKDIYYLRNIIHDWPDQESTLILRNVRKALEPHSRVLIHDYVLRSLSRKQAEVEAATFQVPMAPEPMLPNFGVGSMHMYQQDLAMFILFNAKERTLQDSLELSTAAGLKLEKIWDLGATCVLEFSGV
ncbi:S-adenosyl-L-methionine-dependent methyltransferase, partial [Paxillus ammoniavirescens]